MPLHLVSRGGTAAFAKHNLLTNSSFATTVIKQGVTKQKEVQGSLMRGQEREKVVHEILDNLSLAFRFFHHFHPSLAFF